jgi:uncharacterized membrane protein
MRAESEVVTMENERSSNARAELQTWYLHDLLPRLARAARTGTVAPQELDALDAGMRRLLDLTREREEAA